MCGKLFGLFAIAALGLLSLALLGAGPNQAERPPQPFFQDFISGMVSVQGSPAPEGSLIIACIDDCGTGFESEPKGISAQSTFELLEVNPPDERLIGHVISFYLANEFGRIKAVETRDFVGIFDFYPQDLTFTSPVPSAPKPTPEPTPQPTPTLTPTPSLPVVGDPSVTQLPRLVLIAGGVAVLGGVGLLLVTRRQAV